MKPIKAWAVLVPGTMEPFAVLNSDVVRGTRQYILFCDPDAKEQAEQLSMVYPEGHRFVIPVLITPQGRKAKRK
jgi:hypothetical protein